MTRIARLFLACLIAGVGHQVLFAQQTPAWGSGVAPFAFALIGDSPYGAAREPAFERSSRHIATGLRYLPAIARRLHHCRDLGSAEPFDFLTWFDYAPEHAIAFDALVAELRATEEWTFVEREVDIRLAR
jgi:hypothetical protein